MAIARRIGALIGYWRGRGAAVTLDLACTTSVLSLTSENSVLSLDPAQTVRSLTPRLTILRVC
jgi:hypothetical protein